MQKCGFASAAESSSAFVSSLTTQAPLPSTLPKISAWKTKKKEKEIWTQALSTAWHFKKLHTPATALCFGLTAVNTCPKCRRQSRHPWASLSGGKKKSVGATSSAAEASRTTEECQARARQEKGSQADSEITERCFKPERQKLDCAAEHELSVRTTWTYHASGLLSTKNLKSLTGNCGLWRSANVTRQGDEVIIIKKKLCRRKFQIN